MSSKRLVVVLALLAVVSLSLPGLAAQTTGSISGTVRDKDGGALPGATVTIKGDLLPSGRQTGTDSGGGFRFPNLLPGTYVVSASLTGLGEAQSQMVVAVGKDTQVGLVLVQRVAATAEVRAEVLPLVDVKSTEVAINSTRDDFERLPLGRTYKQLFQLAPGVADNPINTGLNAGGNRQDNTFLYDGTNITNPFFGDIITGFSELDVQEINIKRGGITAEFGRTGGFVVNAVTKSGTNDLHGEARFEYQPKNGSAKYSNGTLGSATDRYIPAAGLGGPLVKDDIWFYASANFPRENLANRTNNFNVRRDSTGAAIDPPTSIPDNKTTTDELFGKLTAAPSPSLFFNGSYRYRKADSTANDICSACSPTVADDNFTKNYILDVGGTWYASPDAFVEAKYNRFRESNGLIPQTELGYRPPFDPTRPDLMGQFVTVPSLLVGGTRVAGQTVGGGTLAVNDQDYFRDEVRVSGSYFAKAFGFDHELKAGFSYDKDGEDLTRLANGWGTVAYSTSNTTCGLGGTGLKAPCFTASFSPQQSTQNSVGKTYGIFVQDRARLGNRLTVLLGLLLNRDVYVDTAGIELLSFGFGDELQPRIGVSYVVDQNVGDKVYGNYGRYYNTDNKSLSRAASRYRLVTSRARFDLTGKLVYEETDPATRNKVVLPGIDPQYTDEVILGYARPIAGKWSAELWGMYRNVKNVIEDFPTTGADTSNPTNYVYGNIDAARRRYRALTLELNRAYGDRWSASLSYTLSRLDGNWDLDLFGDSRFYASSSIEDGPGFYVEDPNHQGILTGDRTHILKIFGSYDVVKNATIGAYFRVQSGTPYQARGWNDYAGTFQYIEPAGSRRTPTWTNLDLLLAYQIPVKDIFSVRVEGRLFNVFNSQPALAVDARTLLNATTANPSFEVPTSYAPPRRFVLAVIGSF